MKKSRKAGIGIGEERRRTKECGGGERDEEERRTEDSRGIVYVDIRRSVYRQKEERTSGRRTERKERKGSSRTKRNANCSGREREENRETIGGAEAAAFHVAWHRLPLKSLLLFVSSSKIMIVCPRDLLLGGSLDAPCTRVYAPRVCVCVRLRTGVVYARARRPRGAPRSLARP